MGSTSAAGLEEGDEVGKLLGRELLVETGGHDRDGPQAHFLDLVARDAYLLVGAGREDDLVGGVFLGDAAEDPAVPRGDDDRLVAPDEAGAGEEDRLEEVTLVAGLADAGQVGP